MPTQNKNLTTYLYLNAVDLFIDNCLISSAAGLVIITGLRLTLPYNILGKKGEHILLQSRAVA